MPLFTEPEDEFKIGKNFMPSTEPKEEKKTMAHIAINFSNGTRAELGGICLDDSKLTLRGHFSALKEAIKNKQPYESGEVWINTANIIFLLLITNDPK